MQHDMVNNKDEREVGEDVTITNEDSGMDEPDLETVEANERDIIKNLKQKLKACEDEKREIRESEQRTKAEFLNARRRLEEARTRDVERAQASFVEQLLPLCDSFAMAMDHEHWEKADQNWRKGIEAIRAQLESLLHSLRVTRIDPTGEHFDPNLHEALATTPVTDKAKHEQVVRVIQAGYVIEQGERTELIRPARVEIGTYEPENENEDVTSSSNS